MIKAGNNPLVFNFFSWYINYIIKKDFSAFEYENVEFDKNKAILILANHYSWWDGFLIFHLNKIFFKKKFHVMVDEDTLKKNGFMRSLGAFSVQKKAKSIINSLKYAGSLLDNPENLVLIFPQGKLHSQLVKEVDFEQGVGRLINYSNKEFQYIFAASFAEYLDRRKPKMKFYLKHWEQENNASALQVIKEAYHQFYTESYIKQSLLQK